MQLNVIPHIIILSTLPSPNDKINVSHKYISIQSHVLDIIYITFHDQLMYYNSY